MRRSTLHAGIVTAAAATLLLAGCGARHDGAGSGKDGAPSRPTAGPASPPASAPACTDRAELTAADSGRTLCLAVGGQVRITLDGTEDRPWTPVRAGGTALRAANAGIALLPGDAVAAFDAVTPGTARLTSARPLCPAGHGRTACQGIRQWTVTVRVTEP
ncbi:hypothetical protein OIE49_14230 [Streptomyces sp. NBC_01788]|uniref:hypothetical protein n=1 Tax=Streptomyces sp. NBC_01788 TaxID=2975940 RepID=UPI002DDABD09|nr:hypothetical protein [Streptomyces sp. NBC_01788]WSB26956.1 hypothetical protein OIE49_14230 [Streptomyces sp. NBC_01788]